MRFKLLSACIFALLGGRLLAQDTLSAALASPLESASTPVVAPSALLATHALTAVDLDAWLDGYMPFALRSGDIAGAVVVIVKDGKVLTERGFGQADIARHTPVDPMKTLFRVGSVSKLITWTAVMQQVETGRINLDRDVNDYLDFKIPLYDGRPVTMRQLMTHTSGFEEAGKNDFLASAKDLRSLEAFLKAGTPQRIYAPGTTPAYSNWATMLAAYIVQRRTGVPFDDYVEGRIFVPLGMTYATFRQPLPPALAPFMATGYSRASEPAKPFENVQVTAAGSLSASGDAMARFMIAHLADGQGILQSKAAQMMHASPIGKVDPASVIPPLNRMELGFFETNLNGREVIGHLGDIETFHTSLHLVVPEGVGLFVSFNSAGRQGGAHPLRVALFQDFMDRYFPTTERDGRIKATTAAEHARSMAGMWRGSRRAGSTWLKALTLVTQTEVTVGKDGDLVVADLKNAAGAVRQWTEIAPFVWRERGGHERLAAKVLDGRPVRWSVDGESPFVVFDRVPATLSAAWILPALYLSLGVLALTFLYWPGSWFVRRRYAAPMAVAGPARRAYHATRIMAGLVLAVLLGWVAFVSTVVASATLLTSVVDPWLWLLQIAGVVAFVGAVGIAAWNAWLTWRDGRRWTRKLWSALILGAMGMILYVAVVFNLIAMTVRF